MGCIAVFGPVQAIRPSLRVASVPLPRTIKIAVCIQGKPHIQRGIRNAQPLLSAFCNQTLDGCIYAAMSDDRALANAVQRKERGAFERLVKSHQGLVWHVIFRLVQHPEDARELSQETFLRVHQRLHQYRGDSPLSGWIAQIAYHLGVRYLQKKRLPLDSMHADDGEDWCAEIANDVDVAAAHQSGEEQQLLSAGIERLPPQQRLLLTLYHLEGLGISEISGITAMPEGTIKNSLFRARLKLRQLLQTKLEVAR